MRARPFFITATIDLRRGRFTKDSSSHVFETFGDFVIPVWGSSGGKLVKVALHDF